MRFQLEERDPAAEIYTIGDTILPQWSAEFASPAFDVIPAELITV